LRSERPQKQAHGRKSSVRLFLYRLSALQFCYTKHHLKFGENQADNLVSVENRFILDFGADFFPYFIGV